MAKERFVTNPMPKFSSQFFELMQDCGIGENKLTQVYVFLKYLQVLSVAEKEIEGSELSSSVKSSLLINGIVITITPTNLYTYLKRLKELGLVSFQEKTDESARKYLITKKGKEFLKEALVYVTEFPKNYFDEETIVINGRMEIVKKSFSEDLGRVITIKFQNGKEYDFQVPPHFEGMLKSKKSERGIFKHIRELTLLNGPSGDESLSSEEASKRIREMIKELDKKPNPSPPYFTPSNKLTIEQIISKWKDEGLKGYDPHLEMATGRYFHGYFKLEDILPYAEFERPLNKELLASVKEHGICEPLIFKVSRNAESLVTEGNHRLVVAQKLGLEMVPVVFIFYTDVKQSNPKSKLSPKERKLAEEKFLKHQLKVELITEKRRVEKKESDKEREALRKKGQMMPTPPRLIANDEFFTMSNPKKAKKEPKIPCEMCDKGEATVRYRRSLLCEQCALQAEKDEAEYRGTNLEEYEEYDEEDGVIPKKENPLRDTEKGLSGKLKSFLSDKGQCYKNAFHWIYENPDWKLVHGLIYNPDLNDYMGHAWCEKDDMVLDPTHNLVIPRDFLYNRGRIEYTVSYTRARAIRLASHFDHYGAWDKKITGGIHKEQNPVMSHEEFQNSKSKKTIKMISGNEYAEKIRKLQLEKRNGKEKENHVRAKGVKTNPNFYDDDNGENEDCEYNYPENETEYDFHTIASEWHGGQFTELYKFSSSGMLDSKQGLINEIEACIVAVEKEPDQYEDDELEKLEAFKEWAKEIEEVESEE